MEIEGKLVQLLEKQSGENARGKWSKQDFVIETQEQYPKKVCISVWNDKLDLSKFNPGDNMNLSINIESREFKGRWYTDVKAWKINQSNETATPQPPAGNVPPMPDSMPDTPPASNDMDEEPPF